MLFRSGTIAEIRSAVLDGNSWYFIRLEGSETFYGIAASTDQRVVILNVGDSVSLQVNPEDSGTILNAYGISTGEDSNDEPEPPTTPPEPEEEDGDQEPKDNTADE